MTYIAKRPLKIGDSVRQIGEPVPEAEEWNRVESWIRFNFIEEVEGFVEKPKKKTVVQRRT